MPRDRSEFSLEIDRARRMSRLFMIAADYRAGMLISKMCEKYECSNGTVLRVARIMGLPKRDRKPDPQRHKKIVAYKGQIPAEDIAKECGCSIALVSKVERANGIKRYNMRKAA